MTRRVSPIARRSLAGLVTLALTGCSGLFVSTPPGKLYRLTPISDFPAGLPQVGAQLLIDTPQAQPGLDTSRIALSRSAFSLDYFADADWTDQVPELFQNLLLASFENSGAITAIDRSSGGLRADFILRTEIRHFEAVYEIPDTPPRVWVAIVARLVAVPRRTIITQHRFEQRAPAAANSVPAVVAAFDAATDTVLRDIVSWTLNNPALSRARSPVI
jgi:cholesterol transport system auxiliary component